MGPSLACPHFCQSILKVISENFSLEIKLPPCRLCYGKIQICPGRGFPTYLTREEEVYARSWTDVSADDSSSSLAIHSSDSRVREAGGQQSLTRLDDDPIEMMDEIEVEISVDIIFEDASSDDAEVEDHPSLDYSWVCEEAHNMWRNM